MALPHSPSRRSSSSAPLITHERWPLTSYVYDDDSAAAFISHFPLFNLRYFSFSTLFTVDKADSLDHDDYFMPTSSFASQAHIMPAANAYDSA